MSFQDLESGRTLPSRRDYINGKQDPTQAVASGVFQINTAVSTFQRLFSTSLTTYSDGTGVAKVGRKTRLHIGQLVKDTSAKLKQASDTDQHTEVSASKKIADAKLAKDFQAVLKEFQKAQRLAAERETAYAPFVPQAVLPSSYTASELDISSDKSPEQRAALVESRRQEVLLLDNEIVFNEAIIEEREQGIQEIQQQIGEVNEIFKDLAVLVHEQGAMIDDIDSNIESSYAATVQAKSQLGKAAKTQKSNSSLVRFGELYMLALGDLWGCTSHCDHCPDSLICELVLSIIDVVGQGQNLSTRKVLLHCADPRPNVVLPGSRGLMEFVLSCPELHVVYKSSGHWVVNL
ncbi:Target SNARE coiled-coil domain [Macleaya cordata]|uniref:Target SNARE coiled-coil domain n=1 Tax=Macleaya cordata TaxID=56857 RepID=A0A200PXF4_MACCD|nr:Target SNARE coiled-coil domain [Macleaya cordata]